MQVQASNSNFSAFLNLNLILEFVFNLSTHLPTECEKLKALKIEIYLNYSASSHYVSRPVNKLIISE